MLRQCRCFETPCTAAGAAVAVIVGVFFRRQ